MLRRVTPAPIRILPWRLAWMRRTEAYAAHPASAAWRLARWTLKELGTEELEFSTADGSSYVTMPANFSSLALFVQGEKDREIHAFIDRHLRQGGTFIDVGANIGLYTVPAARRV